MGLKIKTNFSQLLDMNKLEPVNFLKNWQESCITNGQTTKRPTF